MGGFLTGTNGFCEGTSGFSHAPDCCDDCPCELLEGSNSSCFDTDETPSTYLLYFSGVSECSDEGCEDCSWLSGEFCLDYDSGDQWSYTDGNKSIVLELTDSGSTTITAKNNGDVCFSGSIQINDDDCVKGGYVANDLAVGDCSASNCGYGGSVLFYHECYVSDGCTCCGDNDCMTPEFVVITLSNINNCGTDTSYCTHMTTMVDAESFNGTWVVPYYDKQYYSDVDGTYWRCRWRLIIESAPSYMEYAYLYVTLILNFGVTPKQINLSVSAYYSCFGDVHQSAFGSTGWENKTDEQLAACIGCTSGINLSDTAVCDGSTKKHKGDGSASITGYFV